MKKKSTLLLLVLTLVSCQLLLSQHFHKDKHQPFSLQQTDPPDLYNDYFAGAGACMLCHNSMTDSEGKSVAIVEDWRSSMMANAAKDPLWMAKVSHEVLVNPHLKEEIETVCTRCHAPMGNVNAIYLGDDHYTFEDLANDTLGKDGVSCTVCHQITPESIGTSGNFIIGTNKQIWGPYQDPFGNPMVNHTAFTPVYSSHIKDSRICGSCHTLLTNSLDLDGVPTGEEFVEQAIYHEWKNSNHPDNNTSCYDCHVPEIEDVVKISTMPPWLEGRTPFGMHQLHGGNVFMLKLLRNNIESLGLTASENHFDTTINRTLKNLQLKSLMYSLTEENRTEDTLSVDLKLTNITGHKIPAGFPSRRVFVELFATVAGDTIFHSGKMNSQFNIIEENDTYEPHFNIINSENQVQIYEMVMGDVEENVTTVLERAYLHLKDNRIPPMGFTTEHYSYDTVKIVGNALYDLNFNKFNDDEGTGYDITSYRIPIEEYASQNIELTAKVHYQTVSNKWLEDMFSYESDEIDLFKQLYQDADKKPLLMKELSLTSEVTNIINPTKREFTIYPNPAKTGFVIENMEPNSKVSLYNLSGKLYNTYLVSATSLQVKAPSEKGIYIVGVDNGNGSYTVQKLIIN